VWVGVWIESKYITIMILKYHLGNSQGECPVRGTMFEYGSFVLVRPWTFSTSLSPFQLPQPQSTAQGCEKY
jgi:hypothetical protein